MTIELCKRNDHKVQVKRVNNGIELTVNSKFRWQQDKNLAKCRERYLYSTFIRLLKWFGLIT